VYFLLLNKGLKVQVFSSNGERLENIYLKPHYYEPPTIIENGKLIQGVRSLCYDAFVKAQNPMLDFSQLAITPEKLEERKIFNRKIEIERGIKIDRRKLREKSSLEGFNVVSIFFELEIEYKSQAFLICAVHPALKTLKTPPRPTIKENSFGWPVASPRFRKVKGEWVTDVDKEFPSFIDTLYLSDIDNIEAILKSRKARIEDGRLRAIQ